MLIRKNPLEEIYLNDLFIANVNEFKYLRIEQIRKAAMTLDDKKSLPEKTSNLTSSITE